MKLPTNISTVSPHSTERALALATSFSTKIARTEEAYQDLVQVVSEHYRQYSFKTKKDLKELC